MLALPVLLLAGFGGAHVAAGDLVATTLPTVTLTTPKLTLPTVEVPEVTVPKVTEPKVTEPTPTAPKVTKPDVTAPEAPKPKATVPEATKPKATAPTPTTTPARAGVTADTTPAASSGTSGSPRSTGARERDAKAARQSSKRPRVTKFRAHPPRFKNDPRAGEEMGTTLIFRLSAPATVTVAVLQVAPVCRAWGRFRAAGSAGRNRLAWDGRVEGERLPPGTYRLSIQARKGKERSAVRRETVVVVPLHGSREDASAAPSRCEDGGTNAGGLAALPHSQPIGSGPSAAAGEVLGGGADGAASAPGEGERQAAPFAGPPLPPFTGPGEAPAPWTAPAGAPRWLVSFLYAALVLAALLLALAAFPTLGPGGAVLLDARRRTNLALAGASMLAGLTAAWLLL